jgi:hypothetical protein
MVIEKSNIIEFNNKMNDMFSKNPTSEDKILLDYYNNCMLKKLDRGKDNDIMCKLESFWIYKKKLKNI